MPMLVAGLRAVFGGKTLLLGVLVASVCLFAFALLGARLREKTRGETRPLPWLFFLLCWPFSFYFHTIYTEALFAALAAAVLLALRESRPWVAALACAGLTATRPTGILLAAWIGIRQLWLAWQCRTWRHALVTLAPRPSRHSAFWYLWRFCTLRWAIPWPFIISKLSGGGEAAIRWQCC
jgi:Gpi18-like mannosyltransferase